MRTALAVVLLCSPLGADTITVPGDHSTIQAAINAASTSDIVLVSNGTYAENVVLNKTITLASLFINTADPADITNTTIDGGTGTYAIQIGASAGVGTLVQGFTIIGSGANTDGMSILGHVDIWDNVITVTGQVAASDGIDFEDGSSGTVKRCTIENGGDDAIDLDDRVEVTIEDNVLSNNADDGIEIRLQDYTPAGPLLTVTIRNNEICGNGEDGIQLIDDETLTNRLYIIEGNIICDNAMVGIGSMPNQDTVEDFGGADLDEPVWIINNTISGNDHGITGGDNMVVLNNIIVDSTVLGIKRLNVDSGAAYNLFDGNATDTSDVVSISNSVSGDPLLGVDWTLGAGSPAIDAGIAFYEWNGDTNLDTSDYNGSAPDLGALESTPLPTAVGISASGVSFQ